MAFLSGIAALVYQVAWVKILALSFGNTSAAAGAVIGSIMAGMGVGAALCHKFEGRSLRVFTLYGVIEIGIAVSAIGISSFLYGLPAFYVELSRFAPGPWQLGLLRFISVFVILFVPAALMGATFPALCRAVIRSRQGLERSLGPIYGLNTLGAGVGAVIAGFVLIETFGNLKSIWLANGVNLLVGGVALWLARSEGPKRPLDAVIPTGTKPILGHSLPRGAIVAALIVSGFATMAYEILWMRAAKYLIGNGTYALSSVLAIFLFGLGLGALLNRRILQRRRPDVDLVLTQVGIALFALLAMALQSWVLSSDWTWHRISVFAPEADETSWLWLLLKGAFVSVLILLPPTLWMGVSFPLASSMFTGDIRVLGRHLGGAYFLANLGSIAGVVSGAIWILPGFGTVGGTKFVACLNLLLAGGLVWSLWQKKRLPFRVWIAAGVAVCVLLLLTLPSKMAFRGEIERTGNARLVFWEEGDLATVKVLEHPEFNIRAMTIDGYIIGVNPPYGKLVAQKQLLLAYLPMALAPATRTTLNLGLGSATTLAMLGNYRSVEALHCVEISASVVDGSRRFAESAVLEDRRTRVFVDDAVHFLQRTPTRYDLIVSDAKQNPRFPGNAAILSAEFFEICKSRLAAGGMVVQWVPMSLEPSVFQLVARTFASVFPEVSVYYFPPSCALMTGSVSPIRAGGPLRRFPGLEGYGLQDSDQLIAAEIADRQGLSAALPAGPINTWDHPVFEFLPYKRYEPHFTAEYVGKNLEFLLFARGQSARVSSGADEMAMHRTAHDRIADGIAMTLRAGDEKVFPQYLDDATRIDPGNILAGELREIVMRRGFWRFFDSPGVE